VYYFAVADPQVWVFDVDGTLVDSLTGTALRPGAEALLQLLRDRGHGLLLWSAGGADYARRRAEAHGLARHFDGFHGKDVRGPDGRYVPGFLDGERRPVFVDDRPEDMPAGAEVVAVSPYLSANPHDRVLERVLG
jgi:phosphoglycolate phosphatase-like HAD superfamily hydrolase